MKLTEEKLIELLNAQVKNIVESDGFTDRFKTVIQQMFNEHRNKIVQPVPMTQAKALLENLPYANASGDYIYTDSGSVINLKNKQNPWVKVSNEVAEWASDFVKYVRTGVRTEKLMSTATDTAGGFLVPEDFRAVMIMYDVENTLVWERATVWPMSGSKLELPKLMQNPDVEDTNFGHFAGVVFEWTEEGATKPETEPEFGLLELIVHELAGYTEITNTLLEDSVLNLVNYLTRIFRAAWYWMTDKTFIDGHGGKQPLGVINDPNVLLVNRESAGTVTPTDIINMEGRLPAVMDQGAVFFITKKIRAAIRGTKVNGQLVLQEYFNQFSEPYKMTMLGVPCFLSDGKTPAMGTAGDVILGNWKWYYVGQRNDFSMDSSTHYQFRKNRTALRCSGRVDGQASIGQGFVILGDPS